MNVLFNLLFFLIALLGLFSFLGAVKEKKNRVARIYHKFDPLRKWDPRYPKVFGLPIFIFGLAVVFHLASVFIDVFVAAIVYVLVLGGLRIKESMDEKGETASEK